MQIFEESGLQFNFPKNWIVIKFDEHRFYQYVNGIGLKGVDFICIKANGELLLIEVKNYADRFPQDGVLPSMALLNDPIPYGKQIAQKFVDSSQLITVINKYYLRQFWFRLFAQKFYPYLPAVFRSKFDWAFWLHAYQCLAAQPQNATLIWWMELGEEVSKEQRSLLHDKLLQYFKKAGQQVTIYDRNKKGLEIEATVDV